MLILIVIVSIILVAVAINYVKNYQDSDTGKGYMAGLVISILLYFPALIIALATGGENLPSVIIACLTYVMLMALSGAAINKYR